MSGKENIVSILMRRDGLSREEAEQEYDYVKEEILASLEDDGYDGPDEVLACELGLEPDYICDFI